MVLHETSTGKGMQGYNVEEILEIQQLGRVRRLPEGHDWLQRGGGGDGGTKNEKH